MRTPATSTLVLRGDFEATFGADLDGDLPACFAAAAVEPIFFAVALRVAAAVADAPRDVLVRDVAARFAARGAAFSPSPSPPPLAGSGTSRTTSLASLSSRRPLNDGWRSTPSSVQPVNATCATSVGSTQWTPRAL